jgi:hypothetical protein
VLPRIAAAAAVLSLLVTAPAEAASRHRVVTVCSHRATMYETPGGAVVGVLHRGDDVYLLRRGADGRWWRVRARFGTKGWVRSTSICAEDR